MKKAVQNHVDHDVVVLHDVPAVATGKKNKKNSGYVSNLLSTMELIIDLVMLLVTRVIIRLSYQSANPYYVWNLVGPPVLSQTKPHAPLRAVPFRNPGTSISYRVLKESYR